MGQSNLEAFPILTTERLTLRQLSENDAHEIFLLRSDTIINRYLDRRPTHTLQAAMDFIKTIKDNSLSYWAIEHNGNGNLVGTICLFNISEDLKSAEIGYELLTQYQGNGIMEEAAKTVIQYSTDVLRLSTIDAYTHIGNQGSSNLLKRLGFTISQDVDFRNADLVLYQLHSFL